MKVLVCGGTDFTNSKWLNSVLTDLHHKDPFKLLIEGGAAGADRLARRWAERMQIPIKTIRADWTLYGKRAGPLRNTRMLNEGCPDLVVAFPSARDRGTANMVFQAYAAGVQTLVLKGNPIV